MKPVEYGTVVGCELSPSTDSLLKVFPPVDAETQQVAEKLARFVAEGGPEVETIAAERNRDNPALRSVTIFMYILSVRLSLFTLTCIF